MKLTPYKFEIIAICQMVDEEDKIVGEQLLGRQGQEGASPQPVTVFGVAGLHEFAKGFQGQLDALGSQPK